MIQHERAFGERLGRIAALGDASRVLADLIDADPDNEALRQARRKIEALEGGVFAKESA